MLRQAKALRKNGLVCKKIALSNQTLFTTGRWQRNFNEGLSTELMRKKILKKIKKWDQQFNLLQKQCQLFARKETKLTDYKKSLLLKKTKKL